MYKDIVIIGLGNILLKDDGIGIHMINELLRLDLPDDVELIDAGTAGLDMFPEIRYAKKVVIIDAFKGAKAPGTIYRVSPDEILHQPGDHVLSLHQSDIVEALLMARRMDILPEDTIIIGIEPKDIDWGLGLSHDITQRLPQILRAIRDEIASSAQRIRSQI